MRKGIVLLLLATLSLPLAAQDEATMRSEISTAAAALRTLRCDFVQTKRLSLLNDEMVSRGTMCYQQGGHLRWEYTSPYTYTFILNDGRVLIRQGGHSSVLDVNQSAIFKEIVRIMADCLTGQCLTSSRDFSTTVSAHGDEYRAVLTPLRGTMRHLFASIVLHYDRQKKVVTTIELHEDNGDTTTISLQNIQKDRTLDATVFNID